VNRCILAAAPYPPHHRLPRHLLQAVTKRQRRINAEQQSDLHEPRSIRDESPYFGSGTERRLITTSTSANKNRRALVGWSGKEWTDGMDS
jgi:hypothetical protein